MRIRNVQSSVKQRFFKVCALTLVLVLFICQLPAIDSFAWSYLNEGPGGYGYFDAVTGNDNIVDASISGLPSVVIQEVSKYDANPEVTIRRKWKDGTIQNTSFSIYSLMMDSNKDYNDSQARIRVLCNKDGNPNQNAVDRYGNFVPGGTNYRWVVEFPNNQSQTVPFDLISIEDWPKLISPGSASQLPSGKDKLGYNIICFKVPKEGYYTVNFEKIKSSTWVMTETFENKNSRRTTYFANEVNGKTKSVVYPERMISLSSSARPLSISTMKEYPTIPAGYYYFVETDGSTLADHRISIEEVATPHRIQNVALDSAVSNNVFITDTGYCSILQLSPNRITAEVVDSSGSKSTKHFTAVSPGMEEISQVLLSEENNMALSYEIKTSTGGEPVYLDKSDDIGSYLALPIGSYKWLIKTPQGRIDAEIPFSIVDVQDCLNADYAGKLLLRSDLSKITGSDTYYRLDVPTSKEYKLSTSNKATAETFLNIYSNQSGSVSLTRLGGTTASIDLPAGTYILQGNISHFLLSSISPLVPPAKPRIYSARQDGDEVMIFWREVAGATGYEVERSINGGAYERVARYESTKLDYREIKSRPSNEVHKYRLSAYNEDGYSPYSDEFVVNVYGDVYSTSITTAIHTSTGVKLGWNAAGNASGYEIYRSDNQGAYKLLTTVKGGSKTSYIDTSVLAGGRYSYRLRGFNNPNNPSYSKFTKVVTVDCITKPAISTIKGVCEKTELTWNQIPEASSIEVYRKESGKEYSLIKTLKNVTSYTDTTAKKGKVYSYKILAKGKYGAALCSSEKTVTITGHKDSKKVTPATTKKDGKTVTNCSVCKRTLTEKIYMPKKYSFDEEAVYLGKNKAVKTAVKIYDSKNNLIPSKYYTVTYFNNKEIGTAEMEIEFKGQYSGSIRKNYKIVPKPIKIKKITSPEPGSLKVVVKRTSICTGFQVCYSKDKSFKKPKYEKISEGDTFTLEYLKSTVKYYVKVREYKEMLDGSKMKVYYSPWSKESEIRIK